MTRPTNQELCDAFRNRLTHGAAEMAADGAQTCSLKYVTKQLLLELTRPWRNVLWKDFAEIERRLCPQPEGKADVDG